MLASHVGPRDNLESTSGAEIDVVRDKVPPGTVETYFYHWVPPANNMVL